MVSLHLTFVVLECALVYVTAELDNLLSDEFIDLINSKQNYWNAGRNFPDHTPSSYIKNLMGALTDDNLSNLPIIEYDIYQIRDLPESFDPRDKWPNCPSLNEIRDQGSCGSCWAFGAVEAMTDRYCIHSNGTKHFHFSAQDLMTCCSDCGLGCYGGVPSSAWSYWKDIGIVSGGNYNSSEGCRPYKIPACEHHVPGKLPPCGDTVDTPACIKSCESTYNNDYEKDKRKGSFVYTIHPEEGQIKAELFRSGPVEATFAVYADFVHYKYGVYKHSDGKLLGSHAVKILGWGVENGHKYWLVANSWNSDWGNKGFFKTLRGENHCGIEGKIVTGEPVVE